MKTILPRTLDELLEERADLIRMAEAAEANGEPEMAQVYRRMAEAVTLTINARNAA